MTMRGALAGMIVGAVTVLVWKQFGWFGLYEIVPGFLLASLAILVVSLMDHEPAPVIREVFDEVEDEIRALHGRDTRL